MKRLRLVLLTALLWQCGHAQQRGLFPAVLNLASMADISANATCGSQGPEMFCKLVEHVPGRPIRNPQCRICNQKSTQPLEQHPIEYATDGTNRWWQSPSIKNGMEYHYVTITLDLKQVFQIAYMILKAANSPRPGNWVLERSIDGVTFDPWQYYAITDTECLTRFDINPRTGPPSYTRDDEVICTSFYSKIHPLENGEIHTSLINGRPSAADPSPTLLNFTSARYIRLVFQRIRTLNADLMTLALHGPKDIDLIVTRRYYYSIKDISIGGMCICYGHAKACPLNTHTKKFSCECEHNTCGESCDRCCPGYHQQSWMAGTFLTRHVCEKCNCHGKAEECYFNQTVADLSLSLNSQGQNSGGGVCIGCGDNTAGINCQTCVDGFYRPAGVSAEEENPCIPCTCDSHGSISQSCVADSSTATPILPAGSCRCKEGFGGLRCDRCAVGYMGFPSCQRCNCSVEGSTNDDPCVTPCVCKENVEGENCDRCKLGFYNLQGDNRRGCEKCSCMGVSSQCSASTWTYHIETTLTGWHLLGETGGRVWSVHRQTPPYLSVRHSDVVNDLGSAYYWNAPGLYLGNKLSAYGGSLVYTVSYTTDQQEQMAIRVTSQPDLVIEGGGIKIIDRRFGQPVYPSSPSTNRIALLPENFLVSESAQPISRRDFLSVLTSVTRVMVRASYSTEPSAVYRLHSFSMQVANPSARGERKASAVESCSCPPGYAGTSCETCIPGFRRVNGNLYNGVCEACHCHGHASECHELTAHCLDCSHHTTGPHCDSCLPGYYGNATRGSPADCQPCACPLNLPSNNFSPTCHLGEEGELLCDQCQPGYTGPRCDRCSNGYYGQPAVPGRSCQPCDCNGNLDLSTPRSCDPITGQCLRCRQGYGSASCHSCADGYYGDAIIAKNCQPCQCHTNGSVSELCNKETGRCQCRKNVVGRQCDECIPNCWWDAERQDCIPCRCSPHGSMSQRCDIEGRCICRPGFVGQRCDLRRQSYERRETRRPVERVPIEVVQQRWGGSSRTGGCPRGAYRPKKGAQTHGISTGGVCVPCHCNSFGSKSFDCDETGQCRCQPGVGGPKCDRCSRGFFNFQEGGCTPCQCSHVGNNCDSNTGQCICPPNTIGERCDYCAPNHWGHDIITGCKACGCSVIGSVTQQCNVNTGCCMCRDSFRGEKCNECRIGYRDFPQCTQCECNVSGSDSQTCDLERQVCACADRTGKCNCKANVEGDNCDRCKPDTFGLSVRNPHGCSNCYCYGLTHSCTEAQGLIRMWLALKPEQTVLPLVDKSNTVETRRGVSFQHPEILAHTELVTSTLSEPYYWKLPEQFRGSMITAYGGQLKYAVYYEAREETGPSSYEPQVIINGGPNRNILMTRNVPGLQIGQLTRHEIDMTEHEWKYADGRSMTREDFMDILFYVDYILIKASHGNLMRHSRISEISLTVAEEGRPTKESETAHQIEKCECPIGYSGLSCEECAAGFYRLRAGSLTSASASRLPTAAGMGSCVQCQCSGHSSTCDPETSICQKCQDNTEGDRCERCAPGFYGVVRGFHDDCKPCACPLTNFSAACVTEGYDDYRCTACPEGYEGKHCERCATGYHGNPQMPGGRCEECKCSLWGALPGPCDPVTGQCRCRVGASGKSCDQCMDRHVCGPAGIISCDDECSGLLISDMDRLYRIITDVTLTTPLPPPYKMLYRFENMTEELKHMLSPQKAPERLLQLADSNLGSLVVEMDQLHSRSTKVSADGEQVEDDADRIHKRAEDLEQFIRDTLLGAQDLQSKAATLNQTLSRRDGTPEKSLKEMKEEIQAILAEMRKRQLGGKKSIAEEEMDLAEELYQKVKRLFGDPHQATEDLKAEIKEKLSDHGGKLQDAQDLLHSAQGKTRQAGALAEQNQANLTALERKRSAVSGVKQEAQEVLGEGERLLDEANQLSDNINKEIEDLEEMGRELGPLHDQLDDEVSHLTSGLSDGSLANHVHDAEKHAKQLNESAAILDGILAEAKNLSFNATAAFKAYSNIKANVDAAEKEAKAAKQRASEALALASDPEVPVKEAAQAALQKSYRLLNQAKQLQNDVKENADGVAGLKGRVKAARDKTKDLLKAVNGTMATLNAIPNDTAAKLAATKAVAADANATAIDVLERLGDLNLQLHGLQRNYTELEDTVNAANQMIQDPEKNTIIHAAGAKVKDLEDEADRLLEKLQPIKKLQDNLRRNISQIKELINQARKQANSIKVSVSSGGDCLRSYRPDIRKGRYNTIILNVKTTTPDNLLFYLGSAKYVSMRFTEYIAQISTRKPKLSVRKYVIVKMLSIVCSVSFICRYFLEAYVNLNYNQSIKFKALFSYINLKFTFYILSPALGHESSMDLQISTDNEVFLHLLQPYLSVLLNKGSLEVLLFTGSNSPRRVIRRPEQGILNDGREHSLRIERLAGRSFVVQVDEEAKREAALPNDQPVSLQRIFLGGIPAEVEQTSNRVNVPFQGCIWNLMVNAVLSDFSLPVSFENAEIGQCPNLAPPPPLLPEEEEPEKEKEASKPFSPPLIATTVAPGPPAEATPPAAPAATPTAAAAPPTAKQEPSADVDSCASAVAPTALEKAYQFGLTRNSHMGFAFDDTKVRERLILEFELRTKEESGLVLYMARINHADFVAIQIKDGQVCLGYDLGHGNISSCVPFSINDGNWHKIRVSRNKQRGLLMVDGRYSKQMISPKKADLLDVVGILYVGGLPQTYTSKRIGPILYSINGCIRHFKMVGGAVSTKPAATGRSEAVVEDFKLNMAAPTSSHMIGRCFVATETGTYFEGTGYLKAVSSYRVGLDVSIALEFRTSRTSGVLLGISNQANDGLGLEIVDGKLLFHVDNGAGRFTAEHAPAGEGFCDGQWHSVTAKKLRHRAELVVDENRSQAESPNARSNTCDTNDPIYVGGYPDGVRQAALSTRTSFKGCLRNLKITKASKTMEVQFNKALEIKGVQPLSCPAVAA
ncbi:laminin subunit alpha-2 [Anarrhichthys ocellatus]|uniref:laminin subunit alpha-2 n=1 Tax=Anarrhichthys ocellatus TaxID=433405 RepID=UPI0012ED7880|nr:laminin subunit alpha-2 [Anarrhichthys ocellatus]